MKWIKCSEQLPEILHKEFIVRNVIEKQLRIIPGASHVRKNWQDGDEWLDESESPTPVEVNREMLGALKKAKSLFANIPRTTGENPDIEKVYVTLSEAIANAEASKPTGEVQEAKNVRILTDGQYSAIIEKAFLIGYFNQPDYQFWTDKEMASGEVATKIKLAEKFITDILQSQSTTG
ncbi:MAG TPA: hypothetical protein VGZ90_13655 [Puia sp.]|jgi:hypothetical protein|nr:hypothetical protein [Puia sp.]